MKRSEILKIIKELVHENHRIDEADDQFPCSMLAFSERDAVKVLDALEAAGMLPPSYEGLMRSGEKYDREKHFGSDTMMVRNRWEPEDEKK